MAAPAAPQYNDDEEMPDAQDDDRQGSPEEQEDREEDMGIPVQDSDVPDAGSTSNTPRESQSNPRKRRPGRLTARPSGGLQPEDWGTPEPALEEGSDNGTPAKRRRGRPFGSLGGWRGGFRGRARGGPRGPSHVTRVPIDKEGNTMDVIDDEVCLPEDPEGETKVDKDGRLLGRRDYRVRVFTIKGRGNRLYMLSTEPARCTGFRDSYLFFAKHLHLFKIIIDDYEKRDLIERSIIPHSYKGRAIGVVTARSVFREFGSKIVIGGRKITDDYKVQEARDRGDVEGELADPWDRLPGPAARYNKNQYVAWHGASSVYHNNQPTVPMPNSKPWPPAGKRKANITSANWMFEHARVASRFNSSLTAARRSTFDGVYDPHTNLKCFPAITQPTHARWERVDTDEVRARVKETKQVGFLNGTEASPDQSNGVADTDLTNPDSQSQPNALPEQPTEDAPTRFEPVPPLITRNYLVVDTYFRTPAHATFCTPGLTLAGFPRSIGSAPSLPDLNEAELAELPEECRVALQQARAREEEWRKGWGTEAVDGARARLRIGLVGV